LENSGIRTIARVLSLFYKQKIYYQTIAKWLKKAGELLEEKLNEKSEEIKKIEVLEIDELQEFPFKKFSCKI
jgi:arsenate reductase-like glutaredoxin family protein